MMHIPRVQRQEESGLGAGEVEDQKKMTDIRRVSTTQAQYSSLHGGQSTQLPGPHPVVSRAKEANLGEY